METTMDIDEPKLAELKLAWQTLDRRMLQQSALNLHLLRESKLDKARRGLQRLYWGKIAQILFGDALIYFGIMTTIHNHNVPHLLVCSLFMLVYGLVSVIFGGVIIGRISSIDYTAPVLEIAKRVAALQRSYRIANRCLGLPWWFLWLAIFVLEVKANLGVDLFVTLPTFIWINSAIGVLGFLASLWYLRWQDARSTGKPGGAGVPRSLRDAKSFLEEIARFEQP